jgi:hypothetical protein
MEPQQLSDDIIDATNSCLRDAGWVGGWPAVPLSAYAYLLLNSRPRLGVLTSAGSADTHVLGAHLDHRLLGLLVSRASARHGCVILAFDLLGPPPTPLTKCLPSTHCNPAQDGPAGQVAIPASAAFPSRLGGSAGGCGGYLLPHSPSRSTPDNHTDLSSITARSSLDCYMLHTLGGHSYGHTWGSSCGHDDDHEPGGLMQKRGEEGTSGAEPSAMCRPPPACGAKEPLLKEHALQVWRKVLACALSRVSASYLAVQLLCTDAGATGLLPLLGIIPQVCAVCMPTRLLHRLG